MISIIPKLADYATRSVEESLEFLRTQENGLSGAEAVARLRIVGQNKLPEARTDSLVTVFLRQFQSPLIYILFVASIAVFLLGEFIDGAIILFVLLFNSVIGALQEGKAQNTLRALRLFVATNATVLRDNEEIIVPDEEVVPGDIVLLQEGEKIPADGRIIQVRSLKVDEAALTGESAPVFKTNETAEISPRSLLDQRNLVFKGTYAVAGSGLMVVSATGIDTSIGKISQEITTMQSEIPLKEDIRRLSRVITIAVLVIGTSLFGVGIMTGKTAHEMFLTVVSLLVSVIPEGLPIVLTLVLAQGVWRMSKRNALVKKLHAVEGLGQASVIAVDKTGTITRNEMIVRKIFAGGESFDVDGEGYEPRGKVVIHGKPVQLGHHPALEQIGRAAALSAHARVMYFEEDKRWKVTGDPTEAALVIFGEKLGFVRSELEHEQPLLHELPFDYKTRYHLVVHGKGAQRVVTVAGAPEIIFQLCRKVWDGKKTHAFTKKDRELWEHELDLMLKKGLRVVACVTGTLPKAHPAKEFHVDHIQNFTLLGLYGIEDALRSEAAEAVRKAHSAGIRVVMITGDHKTTAIAVAKKVGIFKDRDTTLTGLEIDVFSDEELVKALGTTTVFARVTPEHKLRIVRAYRERGETIAMTGDGVNDALSLVAADLGVAMGGIGTEVAKEAADIVLLDDNFGSIVSAVEEGRRIYQTIKKVILYLFSTGLGELGTITGALFLNFPLPILPAQIIWLNLVTDSFLDVSLAMEQKDNDLLKVSFKKSNRALVDSLMIERMLIMALPMIVGTLFLFNTYLSISLEKALTISVTTLAVFQWFNAWNSRSSNQSIFSRTMPINKFLVAATVIVISLHVLAIYTPWLQNILHTSPLSLLEWGVSISVASSIIFVEEFRKFLRRKTERVRQNLNAQPTT